METVTAQDYQYSPLPAHNYIRLLRLHSQDQGDPITASLTPHRLDNNLQRYSSLSYSWGRNSDGDASLSRSITVDGGRLSITENLHDCLLRLSSSITDDGYFVWIDAICINQSDVDERNSQVRQMAEIYKRAAALVIWLGEDHEGRSDELAWNALAPTSEWSDLKRLPNDVEILRRLDPQLLGIQTSSARSAAFHAGVKLAEQSVSWKHKNVHRKEWWSVPRERLWPQLVRYGLLPCSSYEVLKQHRTNIDPVTLFHQTIADSSYILDSLGPEFWLNFTGVLGDTFQAMAALCQRRYFQRRWIVQEVFHSRPDAITVHWSRFQVDASSFVESVTKLLDLLQFDAQLLRPLRTRGWLASSVISIEEGTRSSCKAATEVLDIRNLPPSLSSRTSTGSTHVILDFLRRYQDTACSDMRDRVYAFVSVAEQSSIIPDYRLSAERVYTDFAGLLVETGGLGVVLGIAAWQHGNVPERFEALPSWVPDCRYALPLINPNMMAGARKPFEVNRIKDEKVKVSRSGSALTFEALIGVFVRLPEILLQRIPGLMIGDVACKIIQRKELSSGFVLRPVPGSVSEFVLLGDWGEDTEVLPHVALFELDTITVH